MLPEPRKLRLRLPKATRRALLALVVVIFAALLQITAALHPQDILAIQDVASRVPKLGWNPDLAADACNQYQFDPTTNHGIKCDPSNSYIEEIHITKPPTSSNVNVSLDFEAIGWFTQLRTFEVWNTDFSGCPPIRQLFNISSIREILLDGNVRWRLCDLNQFDFSQAPPLQKLSLHSYFIGGLPSWIAALNNSLTDLLIREYRRVGGTQPSYVPIKSIPESWLNLSLIRNLSIMDFTSLNNLDGFLSRLDSLERLTLRGQFGSNYTSLETRTTLKYLILYFQAPGVAITTNFTALSALETVSLYLTAVPPASLFKSASLRSLFIQASMASFGNITDDWDVPNLEQLTLAGVATPSSLPSTLSRSTRLRALSLSASTFYALPSNMSALTELTEVSLSSLTLTAGPDVGFAGLATLPNLIKFYWTPLSAQSTNIMPDFLGQLKSIQTLLVQGNGDVNISATAITNLTNLVELRLIGFKFDTLRFPTDMSSLVNLKKFYLMGYDGSVGDTLNPDALAGLVSLETLGLTICPKLGGKLPPLTVWPNIQSVQLYVTGLGEFPDFNGSASIRSINVYGCQNITSLPEVSPGGAANLTQLVADNLPKVTTLPVSWRYLTSLQELTLSTMPAMTGPFPAEWLEMTELTILNLFSLGITSLPPMNYTKLTTLNSLTNLALTVLPEGFGANMTSMKNLRLVNSPLPGLPDSVTELTNLKYLIFNSNDIVSNLTVVGKLESLETLTLTSIPVSLTEPFPNLRNLTQLRTLNIAMGYNTDLPAWLADLPNLEELQLRGNKIYGELDERLFSRLKILDLSLNKFDSMIPSNITSNCSLVSLNLRYNAFIGPVPSSLANCRSLKYLFLSDNNLAGVFPTEILSDLKLENLDISRNLFEDFGPTRADLAPEPGWSIWPWPKAIRMDGNQVNMPLSRNMMKAIASHGIGWSLQGAVLECPRYNFVPDWSPLDNKSFMPNVWNTPYDSSTDNGQYSPILTSLNANYLCLPGSTTQLACPGLQVSPERLNRIIDLLPCQRLPWTCQGSQPAPNAPCISPGVWLVPRTLDITPNASLSVDNNVTVSGNLTISATSTLKITTGAVIQVTGCIAIQGGRLELNAKNVTRVANTSTEVPVIVSDVGFCYDSSATTTFGSVVVTSGLAPCETGQAEEIVAQRSISVLLTFGRDAACDPAILPVPSSPGGEAVGTDSNTVAIIAGSVAAGVVVLTVVSIIIIFKFRHRIIPAFKVGVKMRKFQEENQNASMAT